jgi:nucleoside-diphosphate-sugar epimerase
MNSKKISVMGVGFVGGRYCNVYPDKAYPEERSQITPKYKDVLYTRSTVSNYNVLNANTRKLDIETNLSHLMDVIPNVHGEFNFVSSWFCYGFSSNLSQDTLLKEASECNPNGFYSITKRAAEQLIQSYQATAEAGLVTGPSSYRILRLCNIIGNDPKANKQKNALEYIILKILNNEEIQIYKGTNFRNYLHVDDACAAINLCIEKGEKNSIYNIGSNYSTKLIDIVEYVIQKTNSNSSIKIIEAPAFHKIVQVENFWMDTEKIKSLGFSPRYTIYSAIDKILDGLKL